MIRVGQAEMGSCHSQVLNHVSGETQLLSFDEDKIWQQLHSSITNTTLNSSIVVADIIKQQERQIQEHKQVGWCPPSDHCGRLFDKIRMWTTRS